MGLRRLQLTLVLTAGAAAAVMLGLFPTWGRVVALAVVVAGAWLTEPERSRRGGGWWMLIGAGAALAVAGFAIAELSEPAETAAGVIAIAGSALVLIGAAVGFPVRR